MTVFPDDFLRLPDGRNLKAPTRPPPELIEFEGTQYRRVSMSAITDEQRMTMTHICRGAMYETITQLGGNHD